MNKDFLDLLVKLKKAEEIPTPPSEPYPDELLNKQLPYTNQEWALMLQEKDMRN